MHEIFPQAKKSPSSGDESENIETVEDFIKYITEDRKKKSAPTNSDSENTWWWLSAIDFNWFNSADNLDVEALQWHGKLHGRIMSRLTSAVFVYCVFLDVVIPTLCDACEDIRCHLDQYILKVCRSGYLYETNAYCPQVWY